ncbi:hypothetical protein SDC9_159143 [bioreactor metagenome]|uniref:Uncharacterized protein n=1 Tax=bioreactor metagenome TaxID=1076179 RepID=A0A645FBU4_9ZZZZ
MIHTPSGFGMIIEHVGARVPDLLNGKAARRAHKPGIKRDIIDQRGDDNKEQNAPGKGQQRSMLPVVRNP